MGYFDRLQKCARYYDADAGEYRWGRQSYTGSRNAGVDYVNNEGLCVVYSAKIHYSAGESGLYELSVSTNFVNPHSSGDPSTAWCYLYFSDPTLGGDADLASPPPGFWGISIPQEFEASTVGSYLTFNFTGLSGMPEQVWFWFACEASYADFGSNQIYHYATGNYNSLLNTGTRTPAVWGGFSGGSGSVGGGDEGGGESGEGRYTLVDSGSYTGIFSETDFSYTRASMTASRTHLSFAGGGSVLFHLRGDKGDSLLNLSLYLSDSAGFDCNTGLPTGNIISQDKNHRDQAFFFGNVSAGQDYWIFAVVERSGYVENELSMKVEPQSWSYQLVDMGSRLNMAQEYAEFSMYMDSFQTGRMEISFDYNAQIELSAADTGDGGFVHVWLSESAEIRSSNGQPVSSICSLQEGNTRNVTVEKGKTYYVFAIYSGGAEAGSVSFAFSPPPVLWYEGDYAFCELLEGETGHGAALDSGQFSRMELSFAHTGTARFQTEGSYVAQSGQRMEAYFCEKDCFNVSTGYPTSHIKHAYSVQWAETADLSFSADVVAGKSYWLYLKNTLRAEGYDTSSYFYLHVTGPEQEPDEYYYLDREKVGEINKDRKEVIYNSRYVISCWELDFSYRGEAAVGIELDEAYSRCEVRCYIAREKGVDKKSGVPTGEILAFSDEGLSHYLSFQANEEEVYYFYLVCPEVYGNTRIQADMSIISPPPVYFSVTDTAEYYGITGRTEHFSDPGMSGVCRLELSFENGGYVRVESRESTGRRRFLHAWVSDTPYLDGLSGEPFGSILAQSHGSVDAPEISMGFYIEGHSACYLFVRDDSVYGSVSFTLSLSISGGGDIGMGGGMAAISPWIYTAGRWRPARPVCRSGGKWRSTT